LIVLASQARWARQTLNCLQHRLEQAAWFWMAAAAAMPPSIASVVARRKTVVAEGLIARASWQN
jgi:hypothetical protein